MASIITVQCIIWWVCVVGIGGGGLSGGLAGGSFISKVLLANADALCAAATPLMEEDIDL